ncbi:MAG: ATP-binding protein [Anaerolineae bacterium]|jgi:signal transduction histidine kinase
MDVAFAQRILQDRKIAYALCDRELRVLEVGGAIEILEGGPAGWLGRSLVDLAPELVGSEPALADILAGARLRQELAWVNRETAEGRTVYLTMVDLPHHDAEGEIAGLLHLVEDRTEAGILKQNLSQSRNELRLAQDILTLQNLVLATANAELRRLDELKSVFVSVAAHELRSPLTAILGYVEMLVDGHVGPLGDVQREYLAVVQDSARRLVDITSSLLDVTRIEAGRVDLALQPTDLPALVQTVATEHEPQVAARDQRLTIHHPPELPEALCDWTRTAQIVGNLLSNAIKYSPQEGQIDITIERAELDGFLQVSVADEGVGIGPGDQDNLFKRFFRAASATQTGASGAGLGLYITRSLVELHGGRIWLESEPGVGSTFYVTLPIAE